MICAHVFHWYKRFNEGCQNVEDGERYLDICPLWKSEKINQIVREESHLST